MKNFAVLSLLFFLAIALTNCRSVPRTFESSEIESAPLKEKSKKSVSSETLKKKKLRSPTNSTKQIERDALFNTDTQMASQKNESRKQINKKAQRDIAQGNFSLYSGTDAADRRILRGGKSRRVSQMFASE